MQAFELFIDLFFIADLILNFYTGYFENALLIMK